MMLWTVGPWSLLGAPYSDAILFYYTIFNRYLDNGEPIFTAVKDKTNIEAIDIHEPYLDSQIRVEVLTKSYIWWTDDPWAALIALAAISILLCIVGIIVLVFTHSR